MMRASRYLPINDSRVPTGEIAPVAGTPFDFRKPKNLRVPPPSSHPQIELAGGYDHCWVLDAGSRTVGRANCIRPASGVRMAVRTNLPGLQVYGAYHLKARLSRLARGLPRAREFPRRAQPREFPEQHPAARRDSPIVHELPVQRVTAIIGPSFA